MLSYIAKRLLYMIPTLLIISIISFTLIQLPPGDYLTSYIAQLRETDDVTQQTVIDSLKKRYGLDQPIYAQYLMWMKGVLQGDFGQSFEWNMPVSELIGHRVALTITVSLFSLIFTYIIAIPIGIYSATHQYSLADYFFTTGGFLGLATPNFLFALVLMFLFYKYFGLSIGGLFSPEFIEAPWSLAKIMDMMNHMWIP
ncbi:unnamed protein product, partial [marine sediment metagenome]